MRSTYKKQAWEIVYSPEVSPNTHLRIYNYPRTLTPSMRVQAMHGVRVVSFEGCENWRFSGEGFIQTLLICVRYIISDIAAKPPKRLCVAKVQQNFDLNKYRPEIISKTLRIKIVRRANSTVLFMVENVSKNFISDCFF